MPTGNPRNDEAILQQLEGDHVAHINAWHDQAGAYADYYWKRDGRSMKNWQCESDWYVAGKDNEGKPIILEKR